QVGGRGSQAGPCHRHGGDADVGTRRYGRGMPEDRTEYASLGEALRAHRVPLENHRLIERLTGAIGIASYYVTSGYIGAERAHGGPALHIASGYTNGFLSEAELLAAVGDYAGD